jgi:hypothetical protein
LVQVIALPGLISTRPGAKVMVRISPASHLPPLRRRSVRGRLFPKYRLKVNGIVN